ncbi:hypothetical protein AAG570_007387 [Ranatra chinensis]|uniref:Uncharacterized protein n=1 Tax=Ranatra chinensis TaxID=642074 RepID=A0ABD0XVQ1_9HEMI
MLSGKWPHYNGRCHPDTMLEARMNQRPQTESVLLQDLEHLAQGLEGRSRNPVAVLVDQLMHPGADQGLDCHPVLDWKSHHRPVDHVVIGKGPPGGAMDGNILTLSLSSWMELPGLRFDDWSREHRQSWSHERQEASSTDQQPPTSGPRRITVEQVANYYTDYVHKNR